MTDKRNDPGNDPDRSEANAINARAARESETLLSSSMKRAADHLAAHDAPENDAIEKWGRRIGRTLGVIVAIYLAFQLYVLLTGTRG